MATTLGRNYDHIDMKVLGSSDVTRHMIQDTETKSKVNDIQNELSSVEEILMPYVRQYTDWTNGSYEANGYQPLPSSKITRKYSKRFPAGTYVVTPSTGLRWEAFYYVSDNSGTQIFSMSSSTRTINATGYFIITIAKTDGETLVGMENEIAAFRVESANGSALDIEGLKDEVEAVETDVTLLKDTLLPIDAGNELPKIESAVLPYVRQYTDWTNGSYEANGYQPLPSAVVTQKYSKIFPAGEYTVKPSTGLRWEAFYYVSDNSGTQIFTFSSSARSFSASSSFVITIGKTGGGSLDGMDLAIAEFSIEAKNDAMLAYKEVQSKSYELKAERYNNINYADRMVYSSLNSGTASGVGIDNNNVWQGRPYSIYIKTNPADTSSEIRINYASAFRLLGTQEFDLAIYIPDATKVTRIRVSIPSANFLKTSSGQTFVNGWNFVRILSEGAGAWTEDTDVTQIRLLVYHTANASETVYIGYFMQVMPSFANMMIIADGPYYTFYTQAYPALTALGVPVVWALDPDFLTDSTDPSRQLINYNDLDTLAYDGISEFSFHSYDGTIMSSATAAQALADTLKCTRFLREKGLEPNKIWRAAWLQNSCAHPELANLELDASASYTGASGVTAYPFIDRYNIPRYGLADRTQSDIDSQFEKLRKQHCTALFYFHGVSEGSDKEVTPAMLTYIIGKISDAINAGYLNPTTYNRLVEFYSLAN